MKNKLAKYQNEYIIFFVEVFFLFSFVENKRSTVFSALTAIPVLILDKRRIKSNIKLREFIF